MPGFRSINVPAAADDPAVRGAVWYPCAETPAAVDLGNFTKLFGITVTGAKDAPITGYMLPLVVVSHGRRSHLVMHHDLAVTLADGGFIVAAINHAGDNYFDEPLRRAVGDAAAADRNQAPDRLHADGITACRHHRSRAHRRLRILARRPHGARFAWRQSRLGRSCRLSLETVIRVAKTGARSRFSGAGYCA